MKRTISIAVLALAISVGAGAAHAQSFSKPYLELGLGLNASGDLSEDHIGELPGGGGYPLTLSVGFDDFLGPAELRFDLYSSGLDLASMFSKSTEVSSLTANLIYDWPVGGERFQLYAGGGLGIMQGEISNACIFCTPGNETNGTATVPVVQAVAGARLKLFDWNTHLYAEGRFMHSGEMEIDEFKGNYSALAAVTGLRFGF
jgi:opacity protein-like surface antigen